MPIPVRHIKNRISAIENTKKITRALEMVSAAKLKRIESHLGVSRRYLGELDRLLKNFLAQSELTIPPVFKKRVSIKTFLLCVVASDTGLCGSYNHRLFELADDFISRYALEAEIQLVIVGKKGVGHFKKMGLPVLKSYLELYGRFSLETSREISQDLQNFFFSSPGIQIFVVYTKFRSLMRLEPTLELLFEPPEPAGMPPVEYIVEPDSAKILEDLIPRYFLKRVQCILLEAFVSEHTSRMISMRQAKDNAEELIVDLTLLKNKIRQAAITTEITEIVSAAEALKE